MQPLINIIKIIGKLEILSGKELIATIQTMMESKPEIIILDLQEVTFADSGGLGAIVRAFKISQSGGVRFVICTSQNQICSIFHLTSMNQIIEIYKTKEEFYEQLKQEIPQYNHYLNQIPELSVTLNLAETMENKHFDISS